MRAQTSPTKARSNKNHGTHESNNQHPTSNIHILDVGLGCARLNITGISKSLMITDHIINFTS